MQIKEYTVSHPLGHAHLHWSHPLFTLALLQSFRELHPEAGFPEIEEAPEVTSYPQGGLGPGGATLLKVEDEKLKEDDLYELLHDTSIPQG